MIFERKDICKMSWKKLILVVWLLEWIQHTVELKQNLDLKSVVSDLQIVVLHRGL